MREKKQENMKITTNQVDAQNQLILSLLCVCQQTMGVQGARLLDQAPVHCPRRTLLWEPLLGVEYKTRCPGYLVVESSSRDHHHTGLRTPRTPSCSCLGRSRYRSYSRSDLLHCYRTHGHDSGQDTDHGNHHSHSLSQPLLDSADDDWRGDVGENGSDRPNLDQNK